MKIGGVEYEITKADVAVIIGIVVGILGALKAYGVI